MKLFFYVAILMTVFFPFSLRCEEEEIAVIEEALPRLPEAAPDQEEVLVANCKGLVLVGNPQDLLSLDELKEVQGVKIIGVEIPGSEQELKETLIPLFLGKSLTASSIEEIRFALIDYFKKHHHPLIVVEIPEQDVTDGVLQLVLFESRVGKVEVEGNTWSSSKRLKQILGVKPHQEINQKQLIQNLEFINRNPFRRADIVYAPGDEPGTTDVILNIDERRPYRFYAGAENTGVPTTGRQRYIAGLNWGNAFGLGHIFAYQFTAAYDINRFQAHTAQYIAPLPWRHILDIYGGASWVHADLDLPSMRTRGFSGQASGRYEMPFLQGLYLHQEMIIGYDFKRTNNTIEFTDEFPTFGKNVNLTQFVLGYRGNYERQTFRLDFEGEIFWSPGSWLSDQSNADFSSLRPDAKNHWVYFRGAFIYLQRLPMSFSVSLKAQGQLSSQNLLPSEQFGLGGYDTVRGYNQREVNTENGLLFSGEVRSPPTPLLRYINRKAKVSDALQFLVFLDYGYGRYKKTIPGIDKAQYLLGTGPGLRYTLERYLTVRLDWGIKLHKKAEYGGGATMVHFAVIGSY